MTVPGEILFRQLVVVCVLTLPSGLVLFYGGMAQPKNFLNTTMQVFTTCCLITCVWMIFGYSLAFRPGTAVIGGASRFWLLGMETWSVHPLAPTIPESVFCTYQMTFAIITPALIVGGLAERMKFSALIAFMAAWSLCVYCPVAHSVWAPDGFLHLAGLLDFAGGTVVHITSGFSALVAALILGKRHGYGCSRFEPHNVSLSMIGASLLWVGWFGFNAGSAYGANVFAGNAMITTQIATGSAALSWMLTEWVCKGKPTVMSVISGAVAGLVAITPACGFVDGNAAIIIGFVTGIICSFSVRWKHALGYDDALDAFGVHGVGGALGALFTGLFASPKLNNFYPGCPIKSEPCLGPGTQRVSGAFYDHLLPTLYSTDYSANPAYVQGIQHYGVTGATNRQGLQLGFQLYGIAVAGAWAMFGTAILLLVMDKVIGIRVPPQQEAEGLDASVHGEWVYYGGKDLVPPHAGGVHTPESGHIEPVEL